MKKYEPIIPGLSRVIHGCDYNPDQWKDRPDILKEDIRLMKLAGINCVSIGIFSWATLEPEDGVYDFEFFDKLMDRLHENNIKAILATPSGARPVWMAEKYPEVLRVRDDGVKYKFGSRHNHCYSSPIYREKITRMNEALAIRYKDHPALGAWHISNEYDGGWCYCENCRKGFIEWLKKRYHNDINELNAKWWTSFWSHTYTSFEQINPPVNEIGDHAVLTHILDWKRFHTDLTIDFFNVEIAPLKKITPDIKVVTNLMGTYDGIDYPKFSKAMDVVSWDAYPMWHWKNCPVSVAADTAFIYNINRSLKEGRPFMLMESTPSKASWHYFNKLKRPGMHALASVQAVAHGSDTVQYFQWRKGRGAYEKFHGAVVDHVGTEHTRVFGEVADVGAKLGKLSDIVGTTTNARVAVIYDWENRWAIDIGKFLSLSNRNYHETCQSYYYPLWKRGIDTDIISQEQDFGKYDLVIAPMLYLIKPGTKERIAEFVKSGGTFVATYLLGEVDENDLCYLGGFPAEELKEVFGVWAEDIDSLYPEDFNIVKAKDGKEYKAIDYCEIIHPSCAETLAEYTKDFYASYPAITKNKYGKGNAYYVACRGDGMLEDEICSTVLKELGIEGAIADLPEMVTCTTRTDGEYNYIFLMNFADNENIVDLGRKEYFELLSEENVTGKICLETYGVRVLKTKLR